jgi:hypothetical protein
MWSERADRPNRTRSPETTQGVYQALMENDESDTRNVVDVITPKVA